MPMIQGIDGNALINAFRAGREDRYTLEQRKRKEAAEEAEAQRQGQIRDLTGQLFGGGGTVSQQYVAPPAQPASAFDQAFGPVYGDEPAPSAAPTQQRQEARRPDPNILAKLIVLDPEYGGKIASAFKTMDEGTLKGMQSKNDMMGAAARFVMQGSPQERLARFQAVAPQLLQAGWSPQELDGVDNDLSDTKLQGYQAVAIDYDKMIDNELAEREFQAGKTVAVQPGGNVAIVKPDGSARWAIGGGGNAANVAQPPKEAIDALRRGEGTPEQFDEMFGPGAAARIMGGGSGNATGGFRP